MTMQIELVVIPCSVIYYAVKVVKLLFKVGVQIGQYFHARLFVFQVIRFNYLSFNF